MLFMLKAQFFFSVQSSVYRFSLSTVPSQFRKVRENPLSAILVFHFDGLIFVVHILFLFFCGPFFFLCVCVMSAIILPILFSLSPCVSLKDCMKASVFNLNKSTSLLDGF